MAAKMSAFDWAILGVLSLFLLIYPAVCADPDSLKLTVILFRHGDRSPIALIPSDTRTEEKDWPEGLGQLTKIGMQQQFANGQYLRKRYDGFIDRTYKHDQIHVRSTDVDRTLMSAQAMLAGLYYPPSEDQVWRAGLPWFPIPIHTEPIAQDFVFRASGGYAALRDLLHYCPLAEATSLEPSQLERDFYTEHQDFLAEVARLSGFQVTNASLWRTRDVLTCQDTFELLRNSTGFENFTDEDQLWRTRDVLYCQKAHNMTWPAWATPELYDKLAAMSVELGVLQNNRSDIRNFHKGVLVHQMAQLFRMKVNGSLDENVRAFVVSAHDSTVIAALASLDLLASEAHIIPYCATLMLELHHTDVSGWFVQLHYKNSTAEDATAYKFTIPGCTSDCPLLTFLNITDAFSDARWRQRCLAPRLLRLKSLKHTVTTAVLAGVGVLFVLVGVGALCARRRRRRRLRGAAAGPRGGYGRLRAEGGRPEEVPMISSNSVGSDLDE